MCLYLSLGFCPRPVTVVKEFLFGSIHPSYQSCFGTVTGWGQFPICIMIFYFFNILTLYVCFFISLRTGRLPLLSLGLTPATATPAASQHEQRHQNQRQQQKRHHNWQTRTREHHQKQQHQQHQQFLGGFAD